MLQNIITEMQFFVMFFFFILDTVKSYFVKAYNLLEISKIKRIAGIFCSVHINRQQGAPLHNDWDGKHEYK